MLVGNRSGNLIARPSRYKGQRRLSLKVGTGSLSFVIIEDEKEKSRNRAPNELDAYDPSAGHQALVEKVN